jgi:hypothetical protein
MLRRGSLRLRDILGTAGLTEAERRQVRRAGWRAFWWGW